VAVLVEWSDFGLFSNSCESYSQSKFVVYHGVFLVIVVVVVVVVVRGGGGECDGCYGKLVNRTFGGW
jgi:hypothetical protein